ncbi:hypothetical protein DCW30_21505 [Streptomyces alfalfae]|nr:hypothetical protein D3X13_27380 [Streptomyces fradiae]RXX40986.1 hypothetical protein DCW30_21505 [Streptomyces alfalfae]RZN03169.1 hypothetical protein D4104_05025 [Streptomyces alfalfae]
MPRRSSCTTTAVPAVPAVSAVSAVSAVPAVPAVPVVPAARPAFARRAGGRRCSARTTQAGRVVRAVSRA